MHANLQQSLHCVQHKFQAAARYAQTQQQLVLDNSLRHCLCCAAGTAHPKEPCGRAEPSNTCAPVRADASIAADESTASFKKHSMASHNILPTAYPERPSDGQTATTPTALSSAGRLAFVSDECGSSGSTGSKHGLTSCVSVQQGHTQQAQLHSYAGLRRQAVPGRLLSGILSALNGVPGQLSSRTPCSGHGAAADIPAAAAGASAAAPPGFSLAACYPGDMLAPLQVCWQMVV